MRILIACEESQVVMKAFRSRGHEAFSCDVQPCSGGLPQYHFQCDIREVLYDSWDMIIAHPPCTYFSKAGACNLLTGRGAESKIKNYDRWERLKRSREFFMLFYNHPCKRVCIENPVPIKRAELPPFSQTIQPYEFGEDYSKLTCLWLKGLPYLFPTIDERGKRGAYPSWVGTHRTAFVRSKTFPKVAEAMAAQWGNL